MRCALTVLTLSFALLAASAASAHPPAGSRTFRYPRVYGATGRPYGPTQAHYQYQRQYGRPWHGYGGLTANVGRGFSFQIGTPGYGYAPYGYAVPPAYGYGYGGAFGLPGPFGVVQQGNYGPVYSSIPMAPLVIQGHPQIIGPDPFDNSVLNEARLENERRWGQDIVIDPQPKTVERAIRQSTPAAKLKSMRAQAQGDEWFRKGNYAQAYARYKVAVSEADDRGVAHFRMAYALVAIGRFERAVREMKRGLRIDPTWPVTGESLALVYGADNVLAKTETLSRVAAWVREDVRDPDRLFLLGVLLHFDDDDRAGEFFETALRLAGDGDHLIAFLRPPDVGAGKQAGPAEPERDELPPVPPQPKPVPPKPVPEPRPDGPELPPLPTP